MTFKHPNSLLRSCNHISVARIHSIISQKAALNAQGFYLSLYVNSPTFYPTPRDGFQQTVELNRIVQSRIVAKIFFREFCPSSSDGSRHLTLLWLLYKLPIQIDGASVNTEYTGSYVCQLTPQRRRLLQYTSTFDAN